jgi:hypothetical protein
MMAGVVVALGFTRIAWVRCVELLTRVLVGVVVGVTMGKIAMCGLIWRARVM